jgi:hypothetical protein
MSLFIKGMECPLCGEPMQSDQARFGTWGVWLPKDDPLMLFCDASMHWDCYADWPYRPRFARSYVDFFVEDEKTNPLWSKALLDENAFVNVNPHPPFELVWIQLYETGNRYDVNLNDWESWLSQETVEVEHRVEARPMALVREILKKRMPTRELLLQALDLERKRPLLEQYNESMRSPVPEEAPPSPCPFCGKPLPTNRAKQCPHCGADWHDPQNVKQLPIR